MHAWEARIILFCTEWYMIQNTGELSWILLGWLLSQNFLYIRRYMRPFEIKLSINARAVTNFLRIEMESRNWGKINTSSYDQKAWLILYSTPQSYLKQKNHWQFNLFPFGSIWWNEFVALNCAGYMEHFHLKGDRVVFIHAFDPVPMQSAKHSELIVSIVVSQY